MNKSASVCSNRVRGLAHSNCQEMCNSPPRLCRYWDALWNSFKLISEKRVCGIKNDKIYLINLLLNTSVAGRKEKKEDQGEDRRDELCAVGGGGVHGRGTSVEPRRRCEGWPSLDRVSWTVIRCRRGQPPPAVRLTREPDPTRQPKPHKLASTNTISLCCNVKRDKNREL